MNWLRNSLIIGIAIVSFLLFIEWNKFEAEHKEANQIVEETLASPVDVPDVAIASTATTVENDVPQLPTEATVDTSTSPEQIAPTLIKINTDTLELLIDTKGGDIIKSALIKHDAKLNEPNNHLILLNRTPSHTYVARSGLVGPNGTDKAKQERPVFKTSQTEYKMDDDQDTLVVDLVMQDGDVSITKRFTLNRNSYLINIEYLIDNRSSETWQAAIYGQIRRDSFRPASDTGIGMKPYVGGAITTPDTNYKKISFGDLKDQPYTTKKQGGWIALVQHHFIGAWVPDADTVNSYKMQKFHDQDLYKFEYVGPLTSINAHSQGTIKTAFYTGPKDIKTLEKISPYIDLTADYSFLWFIAKPLFFALHMIHGIVGNWGVAIILLTCLLKLVFFYPSAISYKSMAKMRKLGPLMADLKERYGEDKARMSQEVMKLYKREKVNPLGGCLPIMLQMPVFMSLYWVIVESVEIRHQPFYFWIADLSVKDPYYILPLIMGATMFIQQKLNPTPPDPMQAKVMQMMPIFFTALFMFFPAGLVLYWVVNNSLSIAQQYYITRQIAKAP